DKVLSYHDNPHGYALALLRLEQSRINPVKVAMGAVSGKNQLLGRIKRITGGNVIHRRFNYGQKLLALLAVTAIFCSLAWLNPQTEEKQVPSADHPGNSRPLVLLPQNARTTVHPPTLEKDPPPPGILDAALGMLSAPSMNGAALGGSQAAQKESEVKNRLTQDAINLLSTFQANVHSAQIKSSKQLLMDITHKAIEIGFHAVPAVRVQDVDIQLNREQELINKINAELKKAIQGIPHEDMNTAQAILIQEIMQKANSGLHMDKKSGWNFNWQDKNEIATPIQTADEVIQKAQIQIQDSLINARVVLYLHDNKKLQEVISQLQQKTANLPDTRLNFKFEVLKDSGVQ
ncbi:MAG: hypothetical protein KGM98_07790, partial [Bacteroidota bacterium]|nr:hypothetical protein [Bacteroidota bacterium]